MSDTTAVLNAPMQPNDAGASTIREYLIALLSALWAEGEGFSGKRPFGNSGWEYDVYLALVNAGLIKGSIDAEGCLDSCDDRAADLLIAESIISLGVASAGSGNPE